MPSKQADHGVIPKWLQTTSSLATHHEQERMESIARPLVQHVAADGMQRPWRVQIDDALGAGLAARSPRVIVTFVDRYSTLAVGDVLQVQAQHLTRPQATVQHEQEDGEISQPAQTAEQCLNISCRHWPRQPPRLLHCNDATDRALAARSAHERLMPLQHAG